MLAENTLSEPLVSTKTIANRFGVTVQAVRRWVRDGRVPCYRVSRRTVRFKVSEVERAIAHEGVPRE